MQKAKKIVNILFDAEEFDTYFAAAHEAQMPLSAYLRIQLRIAAEFNKAKAGVTFFIEEQE